MPSEDTTKTILIIDDETIVRESIATYLEDSGFQIFEAENGKIGIERFREIHPDIVLVDLRMPEMDGLDVLQIITKEAPETPIIVISGTGVLLDAIEALRLGAWDYVMKPIHDMAILEHCVRSCLEKAKLKVENRKYREHLEEEIQKRTAELEERTKSLEIINQQLQTEMAERKRTENELRFSERRYRSLFEGSPISLWEEDMSELKRYFEYLRSTGITNFKEYFDQHPDEIKRCAQMIRITDVNRATLELFGCDDKSRFLVRLGDLITSLDMLKYQFSSIAEGKNFEIECITRTFKGKPIHLLVKSAISFTAEDTWSQIIISVYDLTERIKSEKEKKKLEAHLQQAQKMEAIGTLAGGIAHDFNNILFPILGNTELLLLEIPENSPLRKNLDNILKSATRAKDLVSQILSFSRKSDEERKPLKIQPIIKETIKLLRSSLPSTIEILQKIDATVSPILGNPIQIHQVLMNLCTNAYHAMREKGGKIEIVLKEEYISQQTHLLPNMPPGNYVTLTVSDTGCGMSKDIIHQIFDPYFTTKSPREGTGLGLFVVWGIVKNHGGHISVYSEPNKGATFHIYFPALPKKSSTATIELSNKIIPTGTETILLIDDEQMIIEMEKELLEILGYHVTAFSNSAQALEHFRNHPHDYDLVITDMTMPIMTGLELSKEILRIRPEIPIILCTGFSELVSEEIVKSSGIREYIMKPVLTHKIAQLIRKILDNSHK